MKFDIRQTNIAKGIAILLLLWHHVFFDDESRYSMFTSVLWFRDVPIECRAAVFCKVCVAIFMFLSGYGIYKSYEKSCNDANFKSNVSFIKNRLIKTLSSYWFVFIIFVPLGLVFGRSFIDIYGTNPLHYIADFFGVSYLLYGFDNTMNLTWWYMSVIIVYCIIYPILHKLIKYSGEILLAISTFILFFPRDYRELTIWLLSFTLGMYSSNKNLFERLDKVFNTNIKKFAFTSIMLLTIIMVRYLIFRNRYTVDAIFAFFIILFSYFFISKVPVINTILEELGKKSGLIFMFHTFIYSYYFKGFIYSFKYSLLIYLVLLVICYIVAWLLDWLMKVSGYKKLINKLTS